MENIPGMFRRIPPVTKFILTTTMVVSVPTMLGILPATSVVFDPQYAFQGKEIWRICTAWFYSPSSEFFLFIAGVFLLYHSALNLETNLFDGRSADYAWQITLSAILIMGLNFPLKTAILSHPLLHFLIYRDSCSVKNPYISVLDLVHIPRRYLPWALLALDAIMDGPLAFCRSLTGVLVAHIWLMLIPRPSVLQMAESKTSDDQPKKSLPGWQKYASAPHWVRKVIPNERDLQGEEGRGIRPGVPKYMSNSPYSADSSPETGGTRSDCAISDVENDVDIKLDPTPQCHEVASLRDKTTIPPTPLINTLPTEILIRIFEFAQYLWRTTSTQKEREDSPAVWDRSIRGLMRLGYPEILSHVCSLWREIALSSSILWTQLELYTLGQSPQTFLNRCSTFVPRAQNRDLHLVVRFRHCEREPLSDCDAIKAFCSSISPRLRSLNIDNQAPNDTTFATSIIKASLPYTTPGTLVRFFVKDYGTRTITNQQDNDDGLVGWELPSAEALGISQDVLDSIVHPVKTLQLRGQFFPWTSPAYHGLTELHLLCTRPKHGHRPFVHVSQLREILLACPELRMFHVNINITGQVTHPALAPIPLNKLEELSLRGLSRGLYDTLLPLLAPGPKPLQFTFQTEPETTAPLYCSTILSFFQRTNITSLYILGRMSFDQCISVEQLLTESPANLRILGLERLRISELEPSQLDHVKSLPPIRLSRLYLRKCPISIDALRILADLLPAQVVKLHRPEFQDIFSESEAQAHQEIALMFPAVKWVRSTRDMELWNAWELKYID